MCNFHADYAEILFEKMKRDPMNYHILYSAVVTLILFSRFNALVGL